MQVKTFFIIILKMFFWNVGSLLPSLKEIVELLALTKLEDGRRKNKDYGRMLHREAVDISMLWLPSRLIWYSHIVESVGKRRTEKVENKGRGEAIKLCPSVLGSYGVLKQALGPNSCPIHLLSVIAIVEKVTDSEICQLPHLLKFTA